MVIRVNGGIINKQTLSGGLRFFKISGPFNWTISDGSVNLPVVTTGGGPVTPVVTTYFQVAPGLPVPGSAAELALRAITEKSDIVIIGLLPSLVGAATNEIDIAVSASAFGWGSDFPDYQVAPANANEDQLPTTPTHAALEMATAIHALGAAVTVYTTVGAVNQLLPPVTTTVDMTTVTVAEVSFSLGSALYYNLA